MAKGDVIVGRIPAPGSFQPAAGVEIVITAVSNNANAMSDWGVYAGGGTDWIVGIPPYSATYSATIPKMFISNAGYLQTDNGGTYSGVQVK